MSPAAVVYKGTLLWLHCAREIGVGSLRSHWSLQPRPGRVSRLVRKFLSWFDTSSLTASTYIDREREDRRDGRLGAHPAVRHHAPRLPHRHLGGLESNGGDRPQSCSMRCACSPSPRSITATSRIARSRRRASAQFIFGVLGAIGRAARAGVVGRSSSPSSRAFGQASGRALARAARLHPRAHGLVPVEERLHAGPQVRARPHEVPRAALARPLRHPRAGRLRGRHLLRRRAARSTRAPELGTTGWQMLVWGFFISTIACYHGTYTINSLSHVFGKQRYRTGDQSRNNWFLALITLGEGWHNNHHHYPSSARQGFYWWEVRHHLLRAEGDVVARHHLGPARRARLRARPLARAASGELS